MSHEDDIVVLSDLHFDHVGGILSQFSEHYKPSRCSQMLIYCQSRNWLRSQNPHPRDKASFIPQIQKLLEESGRLHLISKSKCELLGEEYQFHYSSGHTPGLMITEIYSKDGSIFFGSDLIPGRAWIHQSITMGYDRFPELLIDEKRDFLIIFINQMDVFCP